MFYTRQEKALLKALQDGDLDRVQQLQEEGADLMAIIEKQQTIEGLRYHMTPIFGSKNKKLIRACFERNIDKIPKLVKSGANIDFIDQKSPLTFPGREMLSSYGLGPIHIAMELKDLKLAECIRSCGANMRLQTDYEKRHNDSKLDERYEPERIAARAEFFDGIRYLADDCGIQLVDDVLFDWISGADQREGCSTLLEEVKYLIEDLKLDPFYTDYMGYDLIARAEFLSDEPVSLALVDYLLMKGLDPNRKLDAQVWSVRMSDQFKKKVGMDNEAGKRWEADAEVHTVMYNQYQSTALIRASFKGKVKHVRLYLAHGGDPMFYDDNGVCALDGASNEKNPYYDPVKHRHVASLLREAVDKETGHKVTQLIVPKRD